MLIAINNVILLFMNSKVLNYAIKVAGKDILVALGKPVRRCFNAPYTIMLSVTDTCDAACITCDRWKNKADPRELSIQEWKNLLLQISKWIPHCYVTFTGGEPFTKKDFCSLLEYAHKLGLYSHLSTNGNFFDERNCDYIIGAGVDLIQFSLNSISAETHDRYKGIKGLHNKIISAIRQIKKRKPGQKIGVTFVITKDNYRELNDFASFMRDLGVDSINFQPIRDNFGTNFSPNPSLCASVDNPFWKIDNLDELDKQIDLLITNKIKGLPITVPIEDLLNLKTYFRDPGKIHKRKPCDVGFRNIIVSASGEVKLCYKFPIIDNVKNNNIRDIWFSKEASLQRKQMLACRETCVSACLRKMSLHDKLQNFLIRADF